MWKRISGIPRAAVLGGVLVGLVLTIVMQHHMVEHPTRSGLGSGVIYKTHELPTLRSLWMISAKRDDRVGLRDPFSFPSVQRQVKMTPRDHRTEAKPEPPDRTGQRPKPNDRHPAITFEYLGYVGPFRRPFAVFRHNGEITIAKTGQTIEGGFILRSFDEEAVVVTHTVEGRRRRVSVVVAER